MTKKSVLRGFLVIIPCMLALALVPVKDAAAATWGWASTGYVAYYPNGNRTEAVGGVRDTLTDGYCVYIKTYYSGSWHTVPGSRTCSGNYHYWVLSLSGHPDITAVRMYRDNGNYQTIWTGHPLVQK